MPAKTISAKNSYFHVSLRHESLISLVLSIRPSQKLGGKSLVNTTHVFLGKVDDVFSSYNVTCDKYGFLSTFLGGT